MSVLYTKPANDKDYISVSLKEEGVRMQKKPKRHLYRVVRKKMQEPNLSIRINSIRSPECWESVTSYMQRYRWIWREN